MSGLLRYIGVGTAVWLMYTFSSSGEMTFRNYLFNWMECVMITGFTWGSLDWMICRLEMYLPWREHPVFRLAVQAGMVMIVSVITIGIPVLLFAWLETGETPVINASFRITLVIGVLVSFLVTSLVSAREFYLQNMKSSREMELLREEHLKSQLETLRQQVNPHFLFNSLNTLSALIPMDSGRAAQFVQQLSKVYRYVLDSGTENFASLNSEMDFLKSYSFLLQQRFGNSIHWEIQQEPAMSGKIPALSLQLLTENAVKHNVVSTSRPLYIKVIAGNGVVTVRNNLQLKLSPEPSAGTGLANISMRYKLAGFPPPVIRQTSEYFEVVLPLIYTA